MKKRFLVLVVLGLIFWSCGGGSKKQIVSEKDFEEANNLVTFTQERFNEYESAGLSFEEAVSSTISELKSMPNVVEAGLGEDGTTIWFLHSSGIMGTYLTSVRNEIEDVELPLEYQKSYLSSGFAGYAAIFEAPNLSEIDSKIKSILEGAGFVVDEFHNENFTQHQLKNLWKYSITLIFAHGGIAKGQYNFLTGNKIKVDTGSLDIVLDAGLGVGTYEDSKSTYVTVYPKYFETQGIIFPKNSLLYMASCHSLQNDSMAKVLNNHRLGIYLGWNEAVDGFDEDAHTLPCFFEKVTSGKTIDETFSECKAKDSEFGISDFYHKKREKQIHAELKFYPSWLGHFKVETLAKNSGKHGKIGDPCEKDEDCESGECVPEEYDEDYNITFFVDGYCVKECKNDIDCDEQSICVVVDPEDSSGVCAKVCQEECRAGYLCLSLKHRPEKVCLVGDWYFDLPRDSRCLNDIFLVQGKCKEGLTCVSSLGEDKDYYCILLCDVDNNNICPSGYQCLPSGWWDLSGNYYCGGCVRVGDLNEGEYCGKNASSRCRKGLACVGKKPEGDDFYCRKICDRNLNDCLPGEFCVEIVDWCDKDIGACVK